MLKRKRVACVLLLIIALALILTTCVKRPVFNHSNKRLIAEDPAFVLELFDRGYGFLYIGEDIYEIKHFSPAATAPKPDGDFVIRRITENNPRAYLIAATYYYYPKESRLVLKNFKTDGLFGGE